MFKEPTMVEPILVETPTRKSFYQAFSMRDLFWSPGQCVIYIVSFLKLLMYTTKVIK